MEKKKLKKLQLKKRTIASLSQNEQLNIIGGGTTTAGPSACGCGTIGCYTADPYGCDIPTIGWDDGSICFSQTGLFCGDWCYGS